MSVLGRYQIAEIPDGIRIDGEDRPPVDVVIRPFALEAQYLSESGPIVRERFGLFNFGKLLEFIASGLMRQWQGREGWYGAKAWAQQQTARAIARRLREHWLQMLDKIDPNVLAVHRAVFAATFGDAPLASDPELYRREYLVRDILRYPAAAVALRNAHSLCGDHVLRRLHRSAETRQLHQLARQLGLSLHVSAVPGDEPEVTTLLDRLADWKAFFSDTAMSYRSLNRTLMNLPGRVPHRLVCNLRKIHLDRPLTQRLELLALTLYAGIRADRDDGSERRVDHTALFMHASAEQVRSAVDRVSRHLRQALDCRKAGDVRQAIYFLADYPGIHKGTLPGLAEKAARWHRHRQLEQTNAMRRQYGANTPTMLPPIPLPDGPGIRFLRTVGDICAEAEQMEHCVASYIDLAVSGNCYLFHISQMGEEATVEVGIEGQVRQSQGPRNQRNKAATCGKRLLTAWAANFPPTARRSYTPACDDIPF